MNHQPKRKLAVKDEKDIVAYVLRNATAQRSVYMKFVLCLLYIFVLIGYMYNICVLTVSGG